MKKWLNKNITTMEQVEAEDVAFSNQKKGSSYTKTSKTETLPDWAKEGAPASEDIAVDAHKAFAIQYRLYKFNSKDQKRQQAIVNAFNEIYGTGTFEELIQNEKIEERSR